MLSKEDIEEYLIKISAALNAKGIKGEIILCGGAVMTAYYNARSMTKDIDAAFTPQTIIREIASEIAEEEDLESDWLNDGAKGFIDTGRMRFITIARFPGLTVKMPDAEAMLAMKLASARLESKDRDDAIFLMKYLGISDLEQVYSILEKNIHPARLSAKVSFFAQDVFQEYSKSGYAGMSMLEKIKIEIEETAPRNEPREENRDDR